MARVVGLGGIFFRCRDRGELASWYREWLGVPVNEEWGASFAPANQPPGGYSVWGPFREDTEYFQPSEREFMVNLVVDDLEGALAQVEEGGAEIVGSIEEYEFGRFGWFVDPEGTKIELWEPRLPQTGEGPE